MAYNIIKRIWNQNRMVNIEDLCGMAFQAESGGHTFEISGVDDTGAVVPLSGTVAGVFRRPDNADIALTGAAAGGVASVTLTEDCYAVPGRFGLTIFVTENGKKTAVYAAVGTVAVTSGGGVAGETPQDVVDLINAIEAAVATIPASYTNIMAAVAPTYSNSALYPVGSYAWYNGTLYRCVTPITTAESWTTAHWTAAALGSDISSMKSINEQYGEYDYGEIVRPFSSRIVDVFRMTSMIGQYSDIYGTGSRAIMKPTIKDGYLIVYNPDGYVVGVYYRQRSNGNYMGYIQDATVAPFFALKNLDASTYEYVVMAIHLPNGTETNWPETELDTMNKRVFIYTGGFNDNQEKLSLIVGSNLITPDIIHSGKYYYGESAMGTNPNMVYTDLIPIKEKRKYAFPYLTLGYSWYASNGTTVLGGDYIAVESVAARDPHLVLESPLGAAFVGVSVRSGDKNSMVLSELPDSKTSVEKVSVFPVAKSRIVREPLNWLYNMSLDGTMAGSRILSGNTVTFDGEKASIFDSGSILCVDQICMDKSKTDIVFSIPNNGNPLFVLGLNGYYANTSLAISDGAIAVSFNANGTAEVRMGTGNAGSYETVLASLPLTGLQINNGRKYVCSIEKDTINKYIVSVYDALTPGNVASVTIQAEQSSQDENIFTGQVRGWGGPYAVCHSGGPVDVYSIKMYSTAPTYPKVAVWGDSYVENCGRNPDCSYVTLLKKALDGNIFVSGQGGATALQTSYRMAAEIGSCAPQYIILNVGVNDSFNVSVDTYKTALLRLIEMVKEKGAVPILVTIPNVPAGNSTTRAFCEAANPWVRSLGYDYIDIAYALSTGDGITGDSSKFVSDATHPNLVGGQAIFNYIKAFLPYLLWK